MISDVKLIFGDWIAAVSTAVTTLAARLVPQRRMLLTEGDAGSYTARMIAAKAGPEARDKAGDASFRISNGQPDPALPAEWQAALRGGRVEIVLRSTRVFFRVLDFPRQATDFLDGMIRAQIDRVTPWPAGDAVFGFTAPAPIANDRVELTLAATSRHEILPLVQLAVRLGAASVVGWIDVPGGTASPERVKLFDIPLTATAGWAADVPRLLRLTLLGAGVAAALSLAVAAYLGSTLDAEQQDLQHRITQRRAALRLATTGGGGSAETLLARRRQTTPSSVMVLEALSRALPDTTYVTELRIEGDKVQVVGMTQDAPSLVRLLEQSPQFARATFFAPTTRAPNDPGERFHVEAHLAPYFGSGS